MDTPTLHEDHWRWRLDDGGEGSGGAGFHELEDVTHEFDSAGLDVNVRLRFSFHVEVGTQNNVSLKLQYNRNSAGWNDVTSSSIVARSSVSSQFADDDDTTEHGVTFVGSGSFVTVNSGMDEDGDATGSTTTAAQDFWATEFCFQLREADLADSDSVLFRMVLADNTALDSYPSPDATATISLGVGPGEVGPTEVDGQSGSGGAGGIGNILASVLILIGLVGSGIGSGVATAEIGSLSITGLVGSSSGAAIASLNVGSLDVINLSGSSSGNAVASGTSGVLEVTGFSGVSSGSGVGVLDLGSVEVTSLPGDVSTGDGISINAVGQQVINGLIGASQGNSITLGNEGAIEVKGLVGSTVAAASSLGIGGAVAIVGKIGQGEGNAQATAELGSLSVRSFDATAIAAGASIVSTSLVEIVGGVGQAVVVSLLPINLIGSVEGVANLQGDVEELVKLIGKVD